MKLCKLRPIGNKILVKERIFEAKMKEGIIIPETSRERYQNMSTEGEIIAMGFSAFNDFDENERPKIGDIVHYQKYDGIGKKYNNIDYRILLDEEIFAISFTYINTDEDLYDKEKC